jgi:tetratricopeptide (TPR) repeat protein
MTVTRRVPSISLCMIVRDEAETLGRCLAAAAPHVDELVIVDTGSRDATIDIARSFDARLAHFPWCDDFSAARNQSLALARTTWALVLDADELITSADARQQLLEFAERAPCHALPDAGQIELENVTQNGVRSRTLLTRYCALSGGVRYAGRIHEHLVRDGQLLRGRPTGVHVLHDGYAMPSLTGRDKLARNEALLRRSLAEAPDDGYLWYQLGRTLEVGERHAEALAAYEHAVELAREHDPHLPHLFECAATCLRALGRSEQALGWLSQVEALFPERADMVFLVALLALDVGQLARAEQGFLRCLELGERPRQTTATESSLAATTIAPAHNLGVLYECTGRPDGARAAYERALVFRADHAGARAGLERLAGRR